ncbi:hypothetical protein AHAS_Ahas04G0128300 [Arachis hypogaea]
MCAWFLRWRATPRTQVVRPWPPSLGVPRLEAQVARLRLKWHAQVGIGSCRATPSILSGTPICLAHYLLLWKVVLACHTWVLKWHAKVLDQSWRATPSTSSGEPKCLGLQSLF